MPWPLAGNAFQIFPNMNLNILKLSQKYGKVFRLYLPGLDFVVISDENIVVEVLRDESFIKVK
jgi:hypothetical protein